MKLLILSFMTWAIIYIYNIVSHVFYFLRCVRLFNILKALLNKANNEIGDTADNFAKLAMPHAPEAQKILGLYRYNTISHHYDNRTNVENWLQNIDYLADEIDEARSNLFWSLNPSRSFRLLLHAPAWLLNQFGFNLKAKTNNLVSFLGWLIALIGSIYGEEIKNFISRILP